MENNSDRFVSPESVSIPLNMKRNMHLFVSSHIVKKLLGECTCLYVMICMSKLFHILIMYSIVLFSPKSNMFMTKIRDQVNMGCLVFLSHKLESKSLYKSP